MFSCDTMAVDASRSQYSQTILAKNSDRPTGEPQPLCYYAGKEYKEGAVLQTTYLTIPQVRKTYSVVGSRPYWIWGFEMGFNEKGLTIGNEAEGSRMEPESEWGLLGMDLLRLGLERSATAREAIDVITSLLRQYGQKANASALFERTYENTFILTDPKEAWVLETAGREWAARRIKNAQGISNCYSIEDDYDLLSPNAEALAREHRWLDPEEPFNFAKAYSGRLVAQPLGLQRFRRLNKLLARQSVHSFETLKAILRDHYEDELIAPRFGATAGTFMSVCMHMRDWGESETSASLLTRSDPILGIVGRYAPVQPCLSAYIPVYMTDSLPQKMEAGEKEYSDASLWWQVKKLSLLVTVDEKAAPSIRQKLAELEAEFSTMADQAEKKAAALIIQGQNAAAKKCLSEVTEICTQRLYDYARSESNILAERIRTKDGLYGRQKEAIEKYCTYASIPLL